MKVYVSLNIDIVIYNLLSDYLDIKFINVI